MPAGWVSAGIAAVGLVSNLTSGGGGGGGGGGSGGGTSGGTSTTYDPYSPYRSGAADTLNSLLKDPTQVLSQPGFQQQLQTGLQTTARGAAATGQLQSGAEQAALLNLGTNTFSSYYNSMLANYAQYSGATNNPASAALAAQQGSSLGQNRLFGNVNQLASGVGAIANSGIFNSSGNQSSAQNIAGYASSGPSYQGSFGSDTQFGSYDSGAYQGPV